MFFGDNEAVGEAVFCVPGVLIFPVPAVLLVVEHSQVFPVPGFTAQGQGEVGKVEGAAGCTSRWSARLNEQQCEWS